MTTRDVRSQYARLAPDYDRRWARYIARTARETLDGLSVRPGERVLDVGCGTGAMLKKLLEREPAVRAVGVDVSEAMLLLARQRLPPRVPLIAADVHALPFASGSFATVLSASSYHFWADKPRALAELRRVLLPGGRLLLTDWCDDFIACRLCDRVLRVVDRAHAPIASRAACEAALRAAAFDAPAVRRFRAGWLWGMMTASATAGPAPPRTRRADPSHAGEPA